MNLKYLQYFCSLAKSEHYSQTANKLGIEQSSLSRDISKLENELGTILFEKIGRNIKLTEQGKIFLAHIEKGLIEIDTGVKKIKELNDPTKGIINLAFIYTLGPEFLPSLIQRFSSIKKNKNFSFCFYQGNTYDIIENLKESKYDLGFCSYCKDEPEIDFTLLLKQELVIIVSKVHPLARFNSITLADTTKYPFILFLDKTKFINNLFENAGLVPNIVCRVEEDSAIIGLVSINYGIAIIPKNRILSSYNIKILNIINPSYNRSVYVATIKNRVLSPSTRVFKNFVLNESGQNFGANVKNQ